MMNEKYGALSGHHLAPAIPLVEPTPRRLGSLPSFLRFGTGDQSNVLPLSRKDKTATAYSGGSPSLATSAKLSSRRLSSSLGLGSTGLTKRFKWLIAGIVICALILISNSRSHVPTRRLRTRAQLGHSQRTYKVGGGSNGLSLIDQEEGHDEEDWLDEAEPWFSQYDDASGDDDDYTNIDFSRMTEEEANEKKEMIRHKLEVAEHHRAESLRALTWYIAEGGELPYDWEVPTKKHITKIGSRGVEHILQTMDEKSKEEEGEEGSGEEIFEDGWAEFAKARFRTVVFSKTFCPYSKRAKAILENYHLSPAPFVIELDTRPDGPKIQALLDHLTSRRTVPNILLDFVSIGGADDLTLMHAEGGLKRRLEQMEVLPGHRRAAPVAVANNGQGRQGRQVVVKAEDAAAAAAPPAQAEDGVDPVVPIPVPVPAADVDAGAEDDDLPLKAKADEARGDPTDNSREARVARIAQAKADKQAADAEEAADEEEEEVEDESSAGAGTVEGRQEVKKHKLDAFAMQHGGGDGGDEVEEEEASPAVEKKRAQIAQRAKQAQRVDEE